MKDIPMHNPLKTWPAIIISGDTANAIMVDPIAKLKADKMMIGFLPNLSVKGPAIREPSFIEINMTYDTLQNILAKVSP